ncbi:hypothetical protein KZZ52_28495 [Dactylosporangium sp. AC04546]|uniref:hypothetical protein n=1 Tax=Dactylosporangium sp. AC04546 TaxID=2862460 RepID=UPI001EE0671A|nr:hypothetical protein [Dactylosporangium sp. AC04546]WVK89210.1 hypothetical protein KZZ52_28495 [Dactylosporangium sp. AC04546]
MTRRTAPSAMVKPADASATPACRATLVRASTAIRYAATSTAAPGTGPPGNPASCLPATAWCMLVVMRTLTLSNKVGLVLAALLGIADVTGPAPSAVAAALLFPQPTGQESDPFAIGGPALVAVLVLAIVLGLSTITGVVLAWFRGSRLAARAVAAARVVAVLITVPVFLLEGLEAWLYVLAAAVVIVNITTIVLVLSRPVLRTP